MVSRQNNVCAARVFGSFLLVASLYTMGGVSPAHATFASQQTAHGFTSQQQEFDWLAPTDGNAATDPAGQTPTSWGGLGSPNIFTTTTDNQGRTITNETFVNDDPIIPANLLAPKEAIKSALQTYSSIPLTAYVPAVAAIPAQGTPGTAGYVVGTNGTPEVPASPTLQQLSLIKTYTAQLDSDIETPADSFYRQHDIILDASAYYQRNGKTLSNGTNPTNLCDSTNGCFLSIYMVSNPSNIITATPAGASCPNSADQNTQCLAYCSATVSNCPGNFQYNTAVIFDQKVLAWNIISKSQFEAFTLSVQAPLYNIYSIENSNNILEVSLNNSLCTQEELLINGNLCIKYYQYDPAIKSLLDLYNPALGSTTSNFNNAYSLVPFGSPFGTSVAQTGVAGKTGAGAGYGFPLLPGKTVDVQFKTLSGAIPVNSSGISFTQASGYPLAGQQLVASGLVGPTQINPSFAAFHIANGSNNAVFLPTNSVKEFLSFLSHQTVLDTSPQTTPATVIPPGVITATPINAATTKYLALGVPPTPPSTAKADWQGSAACPTISVKNAAVTLTNYPCPTSGALTAHWEGMWTYAYGNAVGCTPATIAAQERFCTAATGAVWQGGAGPTKDCSICKNLPGYNFSLPTYPVGLTGGSAFTGLNPDGSKAAPRDPLFNLTSTTGGGAASGCYVQVACPSVVNWVGSASHCMAGSSHVAVPGDKVVLLSDIKAGDIVLGFDKLNDKIKPFKVKEVTVTQDEQTININRGRDPSHTLGLTANHSIVTGDGKTILAADLKVGDTILLASGDKVKVKNINLSKDKGAVYNLKLDGGIGFIADGVRVLSVHEKAKQDDKL